jgi:hypothetical protein
MFARVLRNDCHERSFSILQTGTFWEVREERDKRVFRRVLYDDWHRVERAKRVFVEEVELLRQAGWVES